MQRALESDSRSSKASADPESETEPIPGIRRADARLIRRGARIKSRKYQHHQTSARASATSPDGNIHSSGNMTISVRRSDSSSAINRGPDAAAMAWLSGHLRLSPSVINDIDRIERRRKARSRGWPWCPWSRHLGDRERARQRGLVAIKVPRDGQQQSPVQANGTRDGGPGIPIPPCWREAGETSSVRPQTSD
jgi:hypothetical protein